LPHLDGVFFSGSEAEVVSLLEMLNSITFVSISGPRDKFYIEREEYWSRRHPETRVTVTRTTNDLY
jgi:hypothetical protein